jgi:hypothetical protein
MNIARLAKEGGFGQIRRLYEIVRIPLKGKLAPVSMIPDVDVKNNDAQLYAGLPVLGFRLWEVYGASIPAYLIKR